MQSIQQLFLCITSYGHSDLYCPHRHHTPVYFSLWVVMDRKRAFQMKQRFERCKTPMGSVPISVIMGFDYPLGESRVTSQCLFMICFKYLTEKLTVEMWQDEQDQTMKGEAAERRGQRSDHLTIEALVRPGQRSEHPSIEAVGRADHRTPTTTPAVSTRTTWTDTWRRGYREPILPTPPGRPHSQTRGRPLRRPTWAELLRRWLLSHWGSYNMFRVQARDVDSRNYKAGFTSSLALEHPKQQPCHYAAALSMTARQQPQARQSRASTVMPPSTSFTSHKSTFSSYASKFSSPGNSYRFSNIRSRFV